MSVLKRTSRTHTHTRKMAYYDEEAWYKAPVYDCYQRPVPTHCDPATDDISYEDNEEPCFDCILEEILNDIDDAFNRVVKYRKNYWFFPPDESPEKILETLPFYAREGVMKLIKLEKRFKELEEELYRHLFD